MNFTRMLKVGREFMNRQCNYSSYRTPMAVSNISSFRTKCHSLVGNSLAPPLPIFTPVRRLVQIGQATRERPQLLTEVERKDFMHVYQTIVNDLLEVPDMEDMKETNGWIERLNAGFLLLDDIMETGVKHDRGRQCWYKVDNLGLTAINDGLLLEIIIYQILEKHFKDKSYFHMAKKVIFDVTYQTVAGESLDLRTGKERMEKYCANTYNCLFVLFA
ncbi:Farnesyl pyrophosphate synthase [Orchesella cincta]|uniref:Farnesyl pyrophosphate synthase n=1 Tax=Orchesella cincta TaxID=48709 RepID=A0A1D2M646_ORCCI|nr:Farnesyl pyrophosphate synthase [Orchesella cincta]